MLVGGFFLLVIELAIIPGFGVVGIGGILMILLGLVLAYYRLDSQTAMQFTIISVISLIGMTLWFFFVFPKTRFAKRFILEARISVEDGYTATTDHSHLVGLEGIATSDLRPSGIARIGEERIDVMSDGDYIPRGTKVKVSRIKNGNVVVIPLEAPKA
jgi:membrane-bound serine protease (ClpP class)